MSCFGFFFHFNLLKNSFNVFKPGEERPQLLLANVYDGEHPKARFSVSTVVKIENLMRMNMKYNIKQIIKVHYNTYSIAKFAFI